MAVHCGYVLLLHTFDGFELICLIFVQFYSSYYPIYLMLLCNLLLNVGLFTSSSSSSSLDYYLNLKRL